jgi:hypothetical protein
MAGITTKEGFTSLEVLQEIQALPPDEGGTGGTILSPEIERKVGVLTRTSKIKFTKIIQEIGKIKPVKQIKTEYSEVDEFPLNVTVATTKAANNGNVIEIMLSEDDLKCVFQDETISFKGVPAYKGTLASNWRYLVGRIIEKKTNGAIVVQCINGKIIEGKPVFADNIPAGTVITRLSTAKKEWDISQENKNRFPKFNYNYGQKRIFQLSESSWSKRVSKTIDWELADQFRLAMIDEEERTELSYLVGTRAVSYDPQTNSEIYTCGGVLDYIDKNLLYNGALTDPTLSDAQKEAKLEDLIKLLFDNNSGSDVRTAFLGTNFYSALNKIKVVQKQIDGTKEPYEYFGMKFRYITYNGFDLLLVRHPLMDFAGYANAAICLDMENIEEHVFEQFEKIPLNLKQMGMADGEAFVMKKTACPVIKFPETHCIAML